MKENVYKLLGLTRTSTTSVEDAVKKSIKRGHKTLSETLRAIIVQEQEHEIDLAAALGIAVPPAIVPVDARNGGILVKDAHAPR